MGGSKKSKRVTWASDDNLCQVRLFLSEDSPSQVRIGTQNHLQAKPNWPLQTGGVGSDDNLPPGFEGIQPANPWTAKLSQIPLVKWKCPPRFQVNSEWRVIAGEESRETETQDERELRVLEAIYPRPSAIPQNPSTLTCIEDSISNDQYTPVVPITPIEDEDATLDTSLPPTMVSQTQHSSHGTFPSHQASCNSAANIPPNGFSATAVEPDVVAAAQAALSSVMSNSRQGSMIDRDLLIKILSDPKMIQQLVTDHQNAPSSSTTQNTMPLPSSTTQNTMPLPPPPPPPPPSSSSFQSMPAVGLKTAASCGPPSMPPSSHMHNPPSTSSSHYNNNNNPSLRSPPKSLFDSVNIGINRRDPFVAPSRALPAGPFYPPGRVGLGSIPTPRPSVPDPISAPSPSMGAPMTKDINYYKSLIQQHGGERREIMPQFAPHHRNQPPSATNQEPSNVMMKPKPKIMKPCIYFNSSKGCRNGANCSFQHDMSSPQQRIGSVPEVQSTKRVKLDREITGT